MKKSIAYVTALAALGGWLAPIQLGAAETAKTTTPVAAVKPTAAKPAAVKPDATKPDAFKVAEDGYVAIRAIHDARLAIFNGETKLCEKLLGKATSNLGKAGKDEAVAKVKGDLIPIDGSIALADTFVPTPEKTARIAKANEHFKAGNAKQGLEELKLGEIGVNFSRVLMPLKETEKQVASATSLVKEHKYYEANLALKAAEDGIVLDSVSVLEFPKAAPKAAKAPKTAAKK